MVLGVGKEGEGGGKSGLEAQSVEKPGLKKS